MLLNQKKKKRTNEAPTKGCKGTIDVVSSPEAKKLENQRVFEKENDSEADTPKRPTSVKSTKTDIEIRPNTHPICDQADSN